MPLKPPLSIAELKAIGERNPDNPDVKALLWEVKRYHVLMSRFYQLARSVPKGGSPGMIAELALNDMADDPVIQEIDKQHEELFGQKVKRGDED